MPEIPLGTHRVHEQLVTSASAIDFLGPEAARVLSTPSLIGLFEMTCRNLLREFLPQGQDSVGARIELRHLAPTPVGMRVILRVEVAAVEGRRVQFRLEAGDEREKWPRDSTSGSWLTSSGLRSASGASWARPASSRLKPSPQTDSLTSWGAGGFNRHPPVQPCPQASRGALS